MLFAPPHSQMDFPIPPTKLPFWFTENPGCSLPPEIFWTAPETAPEAAPETLPETAPETKQDEPPIVWHQLPTSAISETKQDDLPAVWPTLLSKEPKEPKEMMLVITYQRAIISHLEACNWSLRACREHQVKSYEHLGAINQRLKEIIGDSNVSTRTCESCGWVDYRDNIQECHPGSVFPICSRCECECENDKNDESDHDDEGDEGDEHEPEKDSPDSNIALNVIDSPSAPQN